MVIDITQQMWHIRTMTKKVVLYARVSTSEQSLQPQFLELRNWTGQRGWLVVAEKSDVISGTKIGREGLDSVMEMVRGRLVDAVAVVKLDRVARSLRHFTAIVDELAENDVALICTSQGIDTSKDNACGQLQMSVLAAVAQFERALIVERTCAGLAAARAAGKTLGKVSTKMPPQEGRTALVHQWRAGGRTGGYRGLADMLGGVSAATALRVERKVPSDPKPASDTISPSANP